MQKSIPIDEVKEILNRLSNVGNLRDILEFAREFGNYTYSDEEGFDFCVDEYMADSEWEVGIKFKQYNLFFKFGSLIISKACLNFYAELEKTLIDSVKTEAEVEAVKALVDKFRVGRMKKSIIEQNQRITPLYTIK